LESSNFISYIGNYKMHDSRVEKVINGGNEVRVLLKSQEEENITVRFLGVQELVEKSAEGMILYAICEMKENKPYRKFVFANTDEEDEALLEVIAHKYYIE
jgi:hypothetical protein